MTYIYYGYAQLFDEKRGYFGGWDGHYSTDKQLSWKDGYKEFRDWLKLQYATKGISTVNFISPPVLVAIIDDAGNEVPQGEQKVIVIEDRR